MTIYLKSGGMMVGSALPFDALRAMAQFQARTALDSVTDLTNSIGGTPDSGFAVATVAADATNVANAATNLAQKAATEAAMETVKDALLELYTKANAAATKVGLANITYSGGGTAADGTAAAVTVAVTAAATGVPATAFNTFIAAVNEATYNLAVLVNKVAVAADVAPLVLNYSGTPVTTVAAISTSTGTAADPGVTKAIADARLTSMRTNLTTVATRINALFAGPGNAPVVAQ